MMHTSIILRNVGFTLFHKTYFSSLSTIIHPGTRIVIIGRNGAGKSTLLKMIGGLMAPSDGEIHIPDGLDCQYVPQVITEHDDLSGAQRFQALLTRALASQPDVLLLDEPTNHLDRVNRKALMRMLSNFQGTLLAVSHDVQLLQEVPFDQLWHLDEGVVHIFAGSYDDYLREHAHGQQVRSHAVEQLKKKEKKLKQAIEFEQKRAAARVRANKHENDRTRLGSLKERGSRTAGKARGMLHKVGEEISDARRQLFIPEVIRPHFSLPEMYAHQQTVIAVRDGSCGYDVVQPVLTDLHLQVTAGERVALSGANASGKSTFIRALLHDQAVVTTGDWFMPSIGQVGYLDQHYRLLEHELSVFENIKQVKPDWLDRQVREHLNDFLFRKNEEIETIVKNLSGGEKVRLCLAVLAAQSPLVLILDELTNNLDLVMREHCIQVLLAYPGALVVISHDEDFLKRINITTQYEIYQRSIRLLSESH